MTSLLRVWRSLSPAFRGLLLCGIGALVTTLLGSIAVASSAWWTWPTFVTLVLMTGFFVFRAWWVLLRRSWSSDGSSGSILEYIKTRRKAAPPK